MAKPLFIPLDEEGYCLKKSFLWFFVFFLAFNHQAWALPDAVVNNPGKPWFTGPLLTPTARVLRVGHVNLEPYIFWTVTTGRYDKHWKAKSVHTFNQINPQLACKIGIIERVDLSFTLQSYASWTRGKAGTSFGDLPISLNFQLFKGDEDDWLTFAKFVIQETFPTGKFQKLNPSLLGTDSGGQGTYATQIGFAFSKLTHFKDDRYLNVRWYLSTTWSAPVHVKGPNAYGGGPCTRGKVHPGIQYNFQAGAEYTITDNWALAGDIQIQASQRNRFKGRSRDPVTSQQSVQFSLAPAIEYNWNEDLGIIVGPWFTVAGKNSKQFFSFVAALNYFY